MLLPPGTRLGPYEIVELLGKGGMGEVYAGRDSRLGRTIAVKVVSARLGDDQDFKRRFLREARAVSQLQHPNVCTIHDVGSADGIDFLVMEYLEGETLQERLHRGPLDVADVLRIGAEICEGIGAAHRKGIVHRDLKPGNVMLTSTGAKILDFGLARRAAAGDVVRDAPTVSAITIDEVVPGTVPYMAPEQIEGESDTRSDIWALGCILYEMATAERAFTGETRARLIASILDSDPGPAARRNHQVPERLDWILRRCLEKDPERRWQSTRDVAIELDALRNEIGSDAGPSAATEIGPSRRRPADCSVAVLPFVNMSPDPDQAYFADGLAEELINALTRVKGLKVIARTSAFSFKGSNADIATIASKLGVATLVEGSVRKAGNRLRITAQLIDCTSGHHLWSEVYDRTLDDVFEIQEQISRTIVEAIQPSLLGDSSPLVVAPTRNQKAYELYLRALGEQAVPTREHLLQAEIYLREAIELDPAFASAHAALSYTYSFLGSNGHWPWGRVKKHAETLSRRALELDPKSAEAHVALGHLRLFADWDLVAAGVHGRAALELDPNTERTQGLNGLLARVEGRFEEAVTHYRRACELEPLKIIVALQFGRSLYCARRYDEAERVLRTAIEQDPGWSQGHLDLVQTCLASSRESEAVEVAARWLESLRHPEQAAAIRDGYRDGDVRAAMDPVVRWLVRGYEQFGMITNAFPLAILLAQLGRIDEALEWLEQSRRQHDADFVDVNSRPGLDALRSDPRFAAIVRRSGLGQPGAGAHGVEVPLAVEPPASP